MKLLTIIGARPQIIKAAAFSRAVAHYNVEHNDHPITEVILHTGQHYDDNMSAVFFRELGIPEPAVNLRIGSCSHGEQTARMIEGIEKVLLADSYQGIILYGDTNSTLAGAVAAGKLGVPIFHIEAGLRSYNRTMPEEINRIVADHLSTILFTPTEVGLHNLTLEGFTPDSKVRFRDGEHQQVMLSGDVMYDNALYFAARAEHECDILQRLGVQSKQFILATVHRPANTDNAENMRHIFSALLHIASADDIPVILPLHPRTKHLLEDKLGTDLYQQLTANPHMRIIDPASFFEILVLEQHAKVVMTDSGGVQKEAFFFATPTVILRPETEWVEITNAGAGIIADADYNRIIDAYNSLKNKQISFPPLFGDGHAAEHIVEYIATCYA